MKPKINVHRLDQFEEEALHAYQNQVFILANNKILEVDIFDHEKNFKQIVNLKDLLGDKQGQAIVLAHCSDGILENSFYILAQKKTSKERQVFMVNLKINKAKQLKERVNTQIFKVPQKYIQTFKAIQAITIIDQQIIFISLRESSNFFQFIYNSFKKTENAIKHFIPQLIQQQFQLPLGQKIQQKSKKLEVFFIPSPQQRNKIFCLLSKKTHTKFTINSELKKIIDKKSKNFNTKEQIVCNSIKQAGTWNTLIFSKTIKQKLQFYKFGEEKLQEMSLSSTMKLQNINQNIEFVKSCDQNAFVMQSHFKETARLLVYWRNEQKTKFEIINLQKQQLKLNESIVLVSINKYKDSQLHINLIVEYKQQQAKNLLNLPQQVIKIKSEGEVSKIQMPILKKNQSVTEKYKANLQIIKQEQRVSPTKSNSLKNDSIECPGNKIELSSFNQSEVKKTNINIKHSPKENKREKKDLNIIKYVESESEEATTPISQKSLILQSKIGRQLNQSEIQTCKQAQQFTKKAQQHCDNIYNFLKEVQYDFFNDEISFYKKVKKLEKQYHQTAQLKLMQNLSDGKTKPSLREAMSEAKNLIAKFNTLKMYLKMGDQTNQAQRLDEYLLKLQKQTVIANNFISKLRLREGKLSLLSKQEIQRSAESDSSEEQFSIRINQRKKQKAKSKQRSVKGKEEKVNSRGSFTVFKINLADIPNNQTTIQL